MRAVAREGFRLRKRGRLVGLLARILVSGSMAVTGAWLWFWADSVAAGGGLFGGDLDLKPEFRLGVVHRLTGVILL